MKKTLLLSFSALLLLIGINSCKKCYDCEKKCGTCTQGFVTVAGCDGDSTLNGFSVDSWKVYLESQGYTCQYVDGPSEEACTQDDKNNFQGLGYTCVSK